MLIITGRNEFGKPTLLNILLTNLLSKNIQKILSLLADRI
ncbi:hypothetical protein [Enterococcus sp. M190262]